MVIFLAKNNMVMITSLTLALAQSTRTLSWIREFLSFLFEPQKKEIDLEYNFDVCLSCSLISAACLSRDELNLANFD